MTKEEERRESYRKTAALFLVIVVLTLSFLIVKPFLIAILSAAALAYIFYPLYQTFLKKLPKKMRAKELGAILTCLIIILIVLIPAAIITTVVTLEAKHGYHFMRGMMNGQELTLPPFLSQWSGYLPQIKEIATDLAGQLIGFIQGIVKGIPSVILSIFITIFSTYYFLKHGRDLYNFLAEIVPLPEGKYNQIIKRFDDLSRGMIMGQVVVGLVQGVLAALGFMFAGVPSPLLFGALTAIISIIPLLGAALVWVPVDLYLFFHGLMTGNYWPAIILFFYGMFVISLIDNLLKPKIVGDHAKIHPLLVLFGILGGIQLFGLPGILIGPLILTIFDLVIEIYKETL